MVTETNRMRRAAQTLLEPAPLALQSDACLEAGHADCLTHCCRPCGLHGNWARWLSAGLRFIHRLRYRCRRMRRLFPWLRFGHREVNSSHRLLWCQCNWWCRRCGQHWKLSCVRFARRRLILRSCPADNAACSSVTDGCGPTGVHVHSDTLLRDFHNHWFTCRCGPTGHHSCRVTGGRDSRLRFGHWPCW